ncbi:unnamed protein product [Bursaphelenchus xylophilus]|uniref:(pine wood nematode) hypothetical protein n=1 Tax=Bursaphelenchus xylophilus TaxID=6326 RepID=A0A1I7SRX2_BURXY|nr:unnamed protein product [Bursaphelenchus xylophilus]CAG9101753.1 unnamed protein product [Bursaphelenchus xylophilus]
MSVNPPRREGRGSFPKYGSTRVQNEALSAEASSSTAARHQAEEKAQCLRDTLDEARTRRMLTEDNERNHRNLQALREALRNQQRASAEIGSQLQEQIRQLNTLLLSDEERHRQNLVRLEEDENLARSLRRNLEQEMRRPHKARRQPCPHSNSPEHIPLDCTVVVDRTVRRQLIGDRCVNKEHAPRRKH